jgi:DNA polymerase-4
MVSRAAAAFASRVGDDGLASAEPGARKVGSGGSAEVAVALRGVQDTKTKQRMRILLMSELYNKSRAAHAYNSHVSRTILHLDLDAFFCAVEELRTPTLRGKPFAVGGRPQERGVVASCSYAARSFGVRSAMPMSRALRLCPELIIVSHRHRAYGETSEQVMAQLRALSPLVEQISIDEAFVDISELRNPAREVARSLQARVNADLRLPCSIGVAGNKLTAKIATEVGKKSAQAGTYPNAITVVPPGEEAAFLAPLPVEMLWGVGPKTAKRLSELGIRTLGDLASWPENDLAARFGENGREMARHAHGVDDQPVVSERATKSISQEETFARDVTSDHDLELALREMSAEVSRRLRSEGLAGTTIKIKVRWPDFTTLTRQVSLMAPTEDEAGIFEPALGLLKKVRAPGRAVRLLGVGVSGLREGVRQLGLWEAEDEKSRRLQQAMEVLEEKYGRRMVRRGRNSEASR